MGPGAEARPTSSTFNTVMSGHMKAGQYEQVRAAGGRASCATPRVAIPGAGRGVCAAQEWPDPVPGRTPHPHCPHRPCPPRCALCLTACCPPASPPPSCRGTHCWRRARSAARGPRPSRPSPTCWPRSPTASNQTLVGRGGGAGRLCGEAGRHIGRLGTAYASRTPSPCLATAATFNSCLAAIAKGGATIPPQQALDVCTRALQVVGWWPRSRLVCGQAAVRCAASNPLSPSPPPRLPQLYQQMQHTPGCAPDAATYTSLIAILTAAQQYKQARPPGPHVGRGAAARPPCLGAEPASS